MTSSGASRCRDGSSPLGDEMLHGRQIVRQSVGALRPVVEIGDAERADGGFLVGAGLLLFALWVSSTTVGRMIGAAIQDPSAWGLEFALVAVFIALLASLARGRSTLLPWAAE